MLRDCEGERLGSWGEVFSLPPPQQHIVKQSFTLILQRLLWHRLQVIALALPAQIPPRATSGHLREALLNLAEAESFAMRSLAMEIIGGAAGEMPPDKILRTSRY